MKSRKVNIAALILTLSCLALVGSIEILNWQAGDAIARKQTQDPTSPWRIATPGTIRILAQKQYRSIHRLPDSQSLTDAQIKESEPLYRKIWASPTHRLSRMMKWAAWGIPLGILTFVAGIKSIRKGSMQYLFFAGSCCLTGTLTFLITVTRYMPVIGW